MGAINQGNTDLFFQSQHYERIYKDETTARIDMPIHPEHKNSRGFIHGGAILGLADEVAGSCMHADGRSYVTQHLDCNFLNNVKEGTLHAEAKLVKRGRSTGLSEFRITADDGTLVAAGQAIFFCIADKMLY